MTVVKFANPILSFLVGGPNHEIMVELKIKNTFTDSNREQLGGLEL